MALQKRSSLRSGLSSVKITSADRADYDFLLRNARAGRSLGLTHFSGLDQPISLWNYIRIANGIALQNQPCDLLDWGCGYGQMTFLLRRRGFRVTPFDLGSPESVLPDIPVCHNLSVVRSSHSTTLPFENVTFDAVLSCGVLEHVSEGSAPGDERQSLREIARVLRPGGAFLVYQLPQRFAWQEGIIRHFKMGYSHPRRFTAPEIAALLAQADFRVQRIDRANLVPKNLTGIPNRFREAYSRLSPTLLLLDAVLCRVPILNHLAGVMEIVAEKDGPILNHLKLTHLRPKSHQTPPLSTAGSLSGPLLH